MFNDIMIKIITAVITAILLPLLTLAGNRLIVWLGVKIKTEQAARYFTIATSIVISAVKTTMQTYVDTLKKAGTFDYAAQEIARDRCREIILTQITDEVKAYIQDVYGDFNNWVNNQIEATINTLK